MRGKTISTPSDFEGVKMRTMENKVHIATMQALGANAEPIPFPEIYNALQTKQVDGMYNDANVFLQISTYEVAPYVSELPLFTSYEVVSVSKSAFDSLPDDLKPIVREYLEKMEDSVLTEGSKINEGAIAKLMDMGVLKGHNVVTDLAPFREKVKPVYEDYYKDHPEARELVEFVTSLK